MQEILNNKRVVGWICGFIWIALLSGIAEAQETTRRGQESLLFAPIVIHAKMQVITTAPPKWYFNIGIATYAVPEDIAVKVEVYRGEGSLKMWQREFILTAANKIPLNVTDLTSGDTMYRLIVYGYIDASTNQCTAGCSSLIPGKINLRVYVKNNFVCREFGDNNPACAYYSAYITSIKSTDLYGVTLKKGNYTQIYSLQ